MGPDASVRLYQTLITLARQKYGAKVNQDYPEVILHSVPVPDFIENKHRLPDALAMLRQSAAELGPLSGILGIACNTAHLLIEELRAQTSTPFVSMIESTAQAAAAMTKKKVEILATPTTLRSRLYQDALEKYALEPVIPTGEQEEKLAAVISEIIAGNFETTAKELVSIADDLVFRGAETIILGCTELPLVFPKAYPVPIVNSLQVLADALLARYYDRELVTNMMREKKNKVLFVCQSNVGRSQMAEGFYNSLAPQRATSAGIENCAKKYNYRPTPEVVAVMAEKGIDVSQQRIKQLNADMVSQAELVVVLCHRKQCPNYVLNSNKVVFREVKDPFNQDANVVRSIRDEIKTIVEGLI